MTPPPLPHSDSLVTALRTNDFPARFSPMLVKELRQGMRTNLFAVAFILLQTVMILSVLAGLADSGSSASTGFFWFFVVVALLVVQPLRGFNALSSEYSLNTMDLIQLTRLDAWRITLGKWTALNAQTLLFVTGVLPYLVMRYFLGNVNLVADLLALLYLGLGSAFASAITIGCSAFRQFLLRCILIVAFAFGFSGLFVAVQALVIRSGMFGTGGTSFGSPVASGVLFALSLVYGCFFFLSFGASRIAPPSENLATRKRLVAIGFTLAVLAFAWTSIPKEMVVVVGALILGLACIDALTEPLPVYARVLEPFRKRAILRPFALFLAPGWLSGLGFFLLCSALWIGLFLVVAWLSPSINIPRTEGATILLSSVNIILFPLLVIHLFLPRHASSHFTFGLYAFVQAGALMLTIMVSTLSGILHRHDELILALIPIPSVLMLSMEKGTSESYERIYLAIAMLTFLLGILVPLLRQRDAVREFCRHLKP